MQPGAGARAAPPNATGPKRGGAGEAARALAGGAWRGLGAGQLGAALAPPAARLPARPPGCSLERAATSSCPCRRPLPIGSIGFSSARSSLASQRRDRRRLLHVPQGACPTAHVADQVELWHARRRLTWPTWSARPRVLSGRAGRPSFWLASNCGRAREDR